MKHLFYTIAALLLVTTTASAAPFSWDYNGSVNRLLQPQSSVPTEIPVVRSSSTTKASTFANLNNVLYADQFPGADIGVKALAAYASARSSSRRVRVLLVQCYLILLASTFCFAVTLVWY
jgi:hypothetical protein